MCMWQALLSDGYKNYWIKQNWPVINIRGFWVSYRKSRPGKTMETMGWKCWILQYCKTMALKLEFEIWQEYVNLLPYKFRRITHLITIDKLIKITTGSWALPVTTTGVVDIMLSRASFHCSTFADSVHTDRTQPKVAHACLSKLTSSQCFQIVSCRNIHGGPQRHGSLDL